MASDSTDTRADSTAGDSDDPGDSGDPRVPADCASLCTEFADASCFTASCQTECPSVLDGRVRAAQDAFATCAATNPLCFQTVESCIWTTLYPDPVEVELSYTGTDFESFEGLPVRAGVSIANTIVDSMDTTVVDGTFSVSFSATMLVQGGASVLLYVDTNADMECEPGVDFGVSAFLEPSGGFDAPSFDATSPPPRSSHDFVCNYL